MDVMVSYFTIEKYDQTIQLERKKRHSVIIFSRNIRIRNTKVNQPLKC